MRPFVSHPTYPPNDESKITDISADGSVMAGWGSGDGDRSLIWSTSSGWSILPKLGSGGSHADGISSDGSIVVGYSGSPSGRQAYKWTQSEGIIGLGDLSGGIFESRAYGISGDGNVIVGYGSSSSGTEAFRWTSSEDMTGLGDLPGGSFFSEARDTSADGSFVVGFGNTSIGSEAFFWDATNGMRNLQDMLVNDLGLDLTGWNLTIANGISGDGMKIVGEGINPDGNSEAWIATIPEPTSLALLALGSLVTFSRRKRN